MNFNQVVMTPTAAWYSSMLPDYSLTKPLIYHCQRDVAKNQFHHVTSYSRIYSSIKFRLPCLSLKAVNYLISSHQCNIILCFFPAFFSAPSALFNVSLTRKLFLWSMPSIHRIPLQNHFLLHFETYTVSIYFLYLLAFASPNHKLSFLSTGSLPCNFVRILFWADKYLLVYEIRQSNRNIQIAKCGDRFLSEPLGRKCFSPRKKFLREVVKYQNSQSEAI